MPGSIFEAAQDQVGQMASANQSGIDVIAEFQDITFVRYLRIVLPLDGFVFWIRADAVASDPALYNQAPYNAFLQNQLPTVTALDDPTDTKTVRGSLHYETSGNQEENENYDKNHVVFTAESEVSPLNTVAPGEMWLGTFENIRFAFTNRSSFYQQAGLWHYVGDAVYSDMDRQIIDDPNTFDGRQVVSNSLPIWLGMNGFGGPDINGIPIFANGLPLYPSFQAPLNLTTPYATVHVGVDDTEAMAAAPNILRDFTHEQLAVDHVRITFWGVRNDAIMDFVDFVNQFSLGYDTLGIMNMPIPRDDKRTQVDIMALAQKKVIDYKVNYRQFSARDVARKLIKQAVPTYIINDNPL